MWLTVKIHFCNLSTARIKPKVQRSEFDVISVLRNWSVKWTLFALLVDIAEFTFLLMFYMVIKWQFVLYIFLLTLCCVVLFALDHLLITSRCGMHMELFCSVPYEVKWPKNRWASRCTHISISNMPIVVRWLKMSDT